MRAVHARLLTLTIVFLSSAITLSPAISMPLNFSMTASGGAPSKSIVKRAHVATAARQAVGPRPARWCGWYMRTQFGGGPEYNLARNWAKRGRPLNGPRVGAVVVWSHHVGLITGKTDDGQWIVRSGNDGGRVRERPRSVAGAVFRKI
ncbi:hypothetical protein [Methyloceanibacter caenitepidi]|uniref:Peptidase C51 domain-containing protein n=1 Tax=Methyloceanibacter caenitepidi TaxID=1384459 RepID=A0A0A8K0P6_9HYPH|nr:hypothetical protein [Methyloceanibacter caenitepidi]BAQ16548.1 hypothetical protein GL4_1088 [Methyloceanibacter caenitepidi]